MTAAVKIGEKSVEMGNSYFLAHGVKNQQN